MLCFMHIKNFCLQLFKCEKLGKQYAQFVEVKKSAYLWENKILL